MHPPWFKTGTKSYPPSSRLKNSLAMPCIRQQFSVQPENPRTHAPAAHSPSAVCFSGIVRQGRLWLSGLPKATLIYASFIKNRGF
jgi:hypothetical protein